VSNQVQVEEVEAASRSGAAAGAAAAEDMKVCMGWVGGGGQWRRVIIIPI